jgi:hypothetical protein
LHAPKNTHCLNVIGAKPKKTKTTEPKLNRNKK